MFKNFLDHWRGWEYITVWYPDGTPIKLRVYNGKTITDYANRLFTRWRSW